MAHEGWTFLTNHARVLVGLAREPDARIQDVAAAAGITERAAQRIVTDLCDSGYLLRTRVGRRNTYQINGDLPLRHEAESGTRIGELLALLRGPVESST